MLQFLQRLWSSPLKGSLASLPVLVAGFVVNRLAGASGIVSLPAQTAIDVLLLWAYSLVAVCGVAFSYWQRCQREERVERAKKAGRPICGCTEIGEIMLIRPDRSDIGIKTYRCPKCGQEVLRKDSDA
jgi:predicted RNA-binding Zn-ribbon protein involved in translation (DUF1610 family)